jgi:hypothetical protein
LKGEGVVAEKPYLGMLGYTAEGRPFMAMDVDEAKDIGKTNDLSEYVVIPRGEKRSTHHGYIRDDEGAYRSVRTRYAVFRHLLTAGKGGVPSRKDVGLD